MSGSSYEVFMAPSAHKRFKKFDLLLKNRVKEEAQKLASVPYSCEELKGPLRGIRSWHFAFHRAQYRIAFRVLEDKKQIEIEDTARPMTATKPPRAETQRRREDKNLRQNLAERTRNLGLVSSFRRAIDGAATSRYHNLTPREGSGVT
jgi:mRNA-degrading endonuclease RelE of RelBE toxin-antitoxin system